MDKQFNQQKVRNYIKFNYTNFFLNSYIKFLIFLHKYFFPGLYLISKIRLNIFQNSEIAISYFKQIIKKNQQILCLPRSIFAMTTSKAFRNKGALFIGIFYPSLHMHAWIIEDSYNPDPNDNTWINYTPIAIIG